MDYFFSWEKQNILISQRDCEKSYFLWIKKSNPKVENKIRFCLSHSVTQEVGRMRSFDTDDFTSCSHHSTIHDNCFFDGLKKQIGLNSQRELNNNRAIF